MLHEIRVKSTLYTAVSKVGACRVLQATLRENDKAANLKLTHLFATAACGISLHVVAAVTPLEVEKYLEKRASCIHWRGEDGYDKEREADISWFVCQSCSGVDAELARLKKKYETNSEVMEVLSALDPEVEPKDKKETERFCKTTRKPKWYRKRSN